MDRYQQRPRDRRNWWRLLIDSNDVMVLHPTRTLRAISAFITLAAIALSIQWSVVAFDGVVSAALAVLLAGLSLVIGVRHQLSVVELGRSGVTVRNTFRSAQLSWDDVTLVRWSSTGGIDSTFILTFSGKAQLVLRSGRRLTLSATLALSPRRAEQVFAAFRRIAAQEGVRVHPPTSNEGPARQTG